MTRSGTRSPRLNGSSPAGGGTWSKNAPASSQVTKTAVEFQSGPCMMAFTCCTVQFSPTQELPAGCSLPLAAMSQVTAGKLPAVASVTNLSPEMTLDVHSEEL